MIFETIKSAGIAHKSYFIGSKGSAAVIDPRRDCDVYLEIAERNNLKIDYIFETHRNEDYAIGSIELTEIVNAEVYHGSQLNFTYGNPVCEEDKFKLGSIELEIIDTPGHTDESISITVKDTDVSKDVYLIFSGDALFAGETGRIDLYGESEKKRLAEDLYNSIFYKILPLGDHVILCPAHGAGSVCGANIREQELTTVGYEKKNNPLLSCSRDEFIESKIKEQLYYPPYFDKMVDINLKGPDLICRLPELKVLKINEVKKLNNSGAQIIDVRNPTSYGGAHMPQILSIWKDGLPEYAGWMLNYQDPIIIIDEDGKTSNDVRRFLIRLGYDKIYGYLGEGFPNWYMHAEPIEQLELWSVRELRENQDDTSLFLLDVRKIIDWKTGYIKNAHHIYLGYLEDNLNFIPRNKKVVVYCDSGYKSTIACSILLRNGYENVVTILGSMNAWRKAGYPEVKP
jgi:hydroxyacylglutathione hydrolase